MDRLFRIRLLIGDDGVQKLQNATVMVVGCGAVGSFAIEALARSGVGHLVLVDFDSVERTNINRQLFALESTIGMPKVDVAVARVRDINPDIDVIAMNMFFDAATRPGTIPDFVIDAIDSVQSKVALYKWCDENKIPFISSMGAARKVDPAGITVARISQTHACPLAARVRKQIRGLGISDFPVVYSPERPVPQLTPGKEFGSIITVTGAFGLTLANFVINHVINQGG
ncbi:MAG: tRNA threonylcarbamoyladenosine dehydratase [Alphaproteobacteria bacterium]|nr:tRNA threonylcarbamoyladenosine dehydratase [Alphaproteobacteria bacterium]